MLKTVTNIVNLFRSRAQNHLQLASFLKDFESEYLIFIEQKLVGSFAFGGNNIILIINK